LGRSYPLQGAVTIGRSPECASASTIRDSRASTLGLVPSEDGVLIEDLESTTAPSSMTAACCTRSARVGDEIGLDKLRFRLVGAAGHEPIHIEATKALPSAPRGNNWLWVGLVIAVAAAVITIVVSNG
jgi:hypothetical protein